MLEHIVPFINTKIATLDLIDQAFGLCEIIKKGDNSFPAEYCNGEYKSVSDVDIKKSIVYHRLNGDITEGQSDDDTAISCDPFIERSYPLRTVVICKKNILKNANDNQFIDSKIAENIANAISISNNKQLRTDLQADSVSIEVSSINTNRDEVFEDEFDGIEMFVDYEYVLAAIDYTVTVTGNKSCFEVYTC